MFDRRSRNVKRLHASTGPSSLHIVAALLLTTCVVAAAIASVPARLALLIFGGVLAIVVVLAAILLSRRLSGTLRRQFFVYAPLALIVTSMVRISLRDPVNGGGSAQQAFELSLQSLAVAITALGLLLGQYKVKIRPAAALWAAFALFALSSTFWSDHTVFTLLKGTQLLVIIMTLGVVAPNLPSKESAARFLAYFGLILFTALLVGEIAVGGLSAAWRPYEAQSLEFVGGRYRLSILAIHPLTLGDVAGTLALLLLVNRRKRADWIPLALLMGIVVLSFSRAALILAAACILVVLILETVARPRQRAPGIGVMAGLAAILVGAFAMAMNSADPVQLALPGMNGADATSLNGRLPLWNDVWSNFVNLANGLSAALIGHGFGSFRYFGLRIFNYAGEAHSSPLQVLFELGALGLLLWIAAMSASMFNAARRGAPIHENLRRLVPILYLVMLELMDSALSDSRSFELVMLLSYALPIAVLQSNSALKWMPTRPDLPTAPSHDLRGTALLGARREPCRVLGASPRAGTMVTQTTSE